MALPPEKLRTLPELVFDAEEDGYRKDQVRRVLTLVAPVADELEALQARVAEAEARTAAAEARLVEAQQAAEVAPAAPDEPTADYDETLRRTLLLAQQTADKVIAEANTEATDIRRQAEADAAAALDAARNEAAAVHADAEVQRADLTRELADERARRLGEIAAEADTRLQQVRQSLAEVEVAERDALRSEVNDLASSRDRLTGDVETLEGHLAQRREVIRAALAELDGALDDPNRMRPAMPPTVSDAVAPGDPDDAPLRVDAVDALHRDAATAAEASAAGIDLGSEVAADAPAAVSTDEPIVLADAEPLVVDDEQPTQVIDAVLEVAEDAPAPEPPAADPVDVIDVAAESVEVEVEVPEAVPTVADVVADDGWAPEPDTARAPGSSLVTGGLPLPDPAVADTGVVEALDGVPSADDGPMWADDAPAAAEAAPSADPFLEELRRVTSDDAADPDDEALHAFFTTEDEEKRGWFGRRKG